MECFGAWGKCWRICALISGRQFEERVKPLRGSSRRKLSREKGRPRSGAAFAQAPDDQNSTPPGDLQVDNFDGRISRALPIVP